jgi:hypothetical protein
MSQPNFVHSASDHMLEQWMKFLSLVLQDHVACRDAALNSSFRASATRRLLNALLDKPLAHMNGPTSSIRSRERPHNAQLPRSGSAHLLFATGLIVDRDELRGIPFSGLGNSWLRFPHPARYSASWSAVLPLLSRAIVTDISGQCHSLAPMAAHWNQPPHFNQPSYQ